MLPQFPYLLKRLPVKFHKQQQHFAMYNKFYFFIIPTLVTSYFSIKTVYFGATAP